MSSLTKRIITALILITFVLLGTWLSTPFYFSLITGFIVLLTAYEWAKLVRLSVQNIILFLSIILAFMLLQPWLSPTLILGLACLFWTAAFYPVLRYKNTNKIPKWAQSSFILMFMGFMILYPFWMGLNTLFNIDKKWVLLLIFIVAVEDSSAYFIGRQWGRYKLIPHVSPGKTWEGLLGGMIVSLGVIFIALPQSLMGVSLAVIIFAVLGDLLESLVKRIYHAKDSGTWLPGHGGLLDRIDSLTAAVPFFALGCLWWLS